MSLLLDALKKAALDKQNRDLKAYESEVEPSPVMKTARPLVGTDLPGTANDAYIKEELALDPGPDIEPEQGIKAELTIDEAPGFEEAPGSEQDLDFEIEIDALELARHDSGNAVDNAVDNVAEPVVSVVPPADLTLQIEEKINNAVTPDDTATLENSTTSKSAAAQTAQLELAVEPNTQSHPFAESLSLQPAPAMEEAPAAVPTDPATVLTTSAPAELQLEKRPEQRARKAAMAQLLTSSQQAAARGRRRRWLFLGGLSITAMAFIGFYFYYLSLNGTSQYGAQPGIRQIGAGQQPVANQMPAAATLHEDEASAGPASEQQFDQQVSGEETAEIVPVMANSNDVAMVETAGSASVPINPSANSGVIEDPAVTDKPSAARVKNQVAEPLAESLARPVARRGAEARGSPVQARATSGGGAENRAEAGIVQRNAPAPNALSIAIREGYAAYQRGDMTAAAKAYATALELSPHHRDALLGAAAVAVRQGQQQQALHWYQQRLARAPRDDYARAGILALAGSGQPSPELESEVNRLLQEYPKAAHLHFLRGSLHAGKQQWGQAQLAFFEAWRWDKNQPDYAYNLAIAMDHLNQPGEALRLYRQALILAASYPASFAHDPVNERIAQLEAAAR